MKKKLYKSNDDKLLDGVCAGIAEFSDVDPTIVRAVYACLAIFTGIIPGLIIYVVLSVVMPKNPGNTNKKPSVKK